ncbi:MAG: hypothetical protein ABEH66_06790 [Halobacteriales archaeon]
MNSNHYSKLALLVVALVAAAGVAGAVSISGETGDERQVGSEVSVTYTVNEPFQPFQEWTLRGSTELENATWTVREIDTANQTVESVTYPQEDGADPQTFSHPVSQGNNVERLTVTLTGDVPAVSNYTYDPPNTITVAEFRQEAGGSAETLQTYRTHPYTTESREARDAIDSAQEVVGANASQDARQDLQDAIDFYDGEQFDRAIDNAQEAEQKAEQAEQQQDLVELVILVVGAILLLALVVGGVYRYRKNQTGNKL